MATKELVDGTQTLADQQNALNFLEQQKFSKVVSYGKSSDASTKNNEASLEVVPFGQPQPGPLTLEIGQASTPQKATEAFRGTVFVEGAEKFVIGSR